MRTIRNKHYKNKNYFKYLVKMRIIPNKHYKNKNEKSIQVFMLKSIET